MVGADVGWCIRCNILLESQHKVSAAVEKNLKAHGVSLDNRSVHTRSMRSTTNASRHSASEPAPAPAPLSPLPEASLDEDQRSSFSRIPSPPLPPLPTEDCIEAHAEPAPADELAVAPEVLVPVAVQEAGLGRIENLLVALLGRMDEAAVRQQPAPQPTPMPPPLPEKDNASDDGLKRAVSTLTSSEMLDLDADVAIWKSKAKNSWAGRWPAPDLYGQTGSTHSKTPSRRSESCSERASVAAEVEVRPDSDQQNYDVIPVSMKQEMCRLIGKVCSRWLTPMLESRITTSHMKPKTLLHEGLLTNVRGPHEG